MSSQFKKHNIYKIANTSDDFSKISKILDQYINDIDLLLDSLLKEHIFNNGVPDKINNIINDIKKEGREKIKL